MYLGGGSNLRKCSFVIWVNQHFINFGGHKTDNKDLLISDYGKANQLSLPCYCQQPDKMK